MVEETYINIKSFLRDILFICLYRNPISKLYFVVLKVEIVVTVLRKLFPKEALILFSIS